jgi:BirA family biotin operon repressor/biotin-[acetyl-CoA-carboxylase] ligase
MLRNNIKRFHFGEITSTNDKAKELLKKYSDVIVTADQQTKGRGRNKNSWFGSKGNLFFSRGMRHKPGKTFEKTMLLQAAGALAAKKVLTAHTQKKIFILKYPNDVLVKSGNDYLKICGVVTEHSFMGAECSESIIGIGINLIDEDYPSELAGRAASVQNLGVNADINAITELLIVELEQLINTDDNDLFEIWKNELNIERKEITILHKEQRYIVRKLNKNGTLCAENTLNKEIITIDNGDSIRYEYE